MKILITLLFFCLSVSCFSQSDSLKIPPIDTDRPDQTESVNTVPKKWLQFEAGFNYQKNDDVSKEYLLPTLLSKYGLSNRIELRLITTVLRQSIDNPPSVKFHNTELEQVEIGAKVALFEEKNLLPKTSLLFHVGIPGLASFETGHFLFNTRLSMQHTLTKNISLGYNLGVEFDGTSDDPVFIYTITSGINLSEKWYTYIEAFGDFQKNGAHSLDGGLAYFLSDDIKLDISSGFGISGNAPKNYISLGASVRFNTTNK
jgi:hypothetical protein